MNILVCINQVPDTTSKINFSPDNTQLDTKGVQYVLNPNDEFGLTKALMLQQSHGATVDVIHIGGQDAEITIRRALAIGANSAIRVDVPTPIDGFFVANQIAEVVRKGNYTLIIAGKESSDYNGGMVPGILAALLDYNFVNNCIGLTIEGTSATAIREIDNGKEEIETSLPLIIGGKKGLVEEKDFKIPNMKGIISSRTMPITVLEPVTCPENTKTIQYEKPSLKQSVKMFTIENLDELVGILHTEFSD